MEQQESKYCSEFPPLFLPASFPPSPTTPSLPPSLPLQFHSNPHTRDKKGRRLMPASPVGVDGGRRGGEGELTAEQVGHCNLSLRNLLIHTEQSGMVEMETVSHASVSLLQVAATCVYACGACVLLLYDCCH